MIPHSYIKHVACWLPALLSTVFSHCTTLSNTFSKMNYNCTGLEAEEQARIREGKNKELEGDKKINWTRNGKKIEIKAEHI